MGAISKEEEALVARLDAAFAGQRAALSARQLAVVRAWQRTDREYELAQAVARSEIDPDGLSPLVAAAALEFQQDLDDAIRSARLPFDLAVYRGVRSRRRTFGVDAPDDIETGPRSFEGYTATSVLRGVALDEFTAPEGALMEIAVPKGMPALWVAGVGTRRLRRQGELLLQDNLEMRICHRRSEYGLCILSMEAIPR
jgi:hypothetical protein